MTKRIIIIVVLALLAGGAGWQWLRPVQGAHVLPAPRRAVDEVWRGADSCAAAACHGGPQGAGKGSEYTTWAASDPHARAYQVLFDARSRAIVKNLFDLPSLKDARPEKTALCLQCHVAPSEARMPARFHMDGVSCESCHGPAGGWLTQHYRPAWQALTAEQKSAAGFRQTKDLPTRIHDCVACHVGAPGTEVNHDLLAAGHPRLNFEFASYQSILPKHWRRADDLKRYPDFEARSWALGQAASAKAAIDVLADRARRADSPWPEFADNDCYRCHQDLRPGVRTQTAPLPPAALRWNDWYYDELPTVLALGRPVDPAADLAVLQGELARSRPRRDVIGPAATRLSAQLGDWLAQPLPTLAPAQVRSLLEDRTAALTKDAGADWDRAAQDYLAAAALHHAVKDYDPHFADPALLTLLRQRRQELAFPAGVRSPRLKEAP